MEGTNNRFGDFRTGSDNDDGHGRGDDDCDDDDDNGSGGEWWWLKDDAHDNDIDGDHDVMPFELDKNQKKHRRNGKETLLLSSVIARLHVLFFFPGRAITGILQRAQLACMTYNRACKVEFQPPIGPIHSCRFRIFLIKLVLHCGEQITPFPSVESCTYVQVLVKYRRVLDTAFHGVFAPTLKACFNTAADPYTMLSWRSLF